MSVYISDFRTISVVDSFDYGILKGLNNRQKSAVEPDYKKIISSNMLRRMNKAQRLGVGCALSMTCDELPDGIVVGTGIGCYSNSVSFASHYTTKLEGALSPTAFIHSTDNTIASQIGIIQQNCGYNNTYVHKGVAFENALLDGSLLVKEGRRRVLVGGVDEKLQDLVFDDRENLGEGASFFCLTQEKQKIKLDITWILSSTPDRIEKDLLSFLKKNNLAKPDVVLIGSSFERDKFPIFNDVSINTINYSELSGIYFTNSAFGLQLGCEMLINPGIGPSWNGCFRRILVVNSFFDELYGITYISRNE